MKKLITLTLFLSFVHVLYAQSGTHIVKLKIDRPLFRGITCEEVIDKRMISDNIGFAQKGLANRKVPVHFEEAFTPYLAKHINKLFFAEEDQRALVFIFHELNVSERTTAFSERGFCRMDIEFAEYRDSSLYSLGRYDCDIEKKGGDVTKKHDDNILECLTNCITSFYQSDWKNLEPELIENQEQEDEATSYDYNNIPTKGFYTSFSTLAKGQPLENVEFSLYKIDAPAKQEKYTVAKMDKTIKRKIMFISDGESIYIHGSRYATLNYFTKARHMGKYIYFEDKYANPAAGAAFGLLGAVASNTTKGIILDTTTGLVSILDHKTLFNLIKDHPDILETYNKSKGKLADRRKALLELNSKVQ